MDVIVIFLYDFYLVLDDHPHGLKVISIWGKKDKCKYLTSNECTVIHTHDRDQQMKLHLLQWDKT